MDHIRKISNIATKQTVTFVQIAIGIIVFEVNRILNFENISKLSYKYSPKGPLIREAVLPYADSIFN